MDTNKNAAPATMPLADAACRELLACDSTASTHYAHLVRQNADLTERLAERREVLDQTRREYFKLEQERDAYKAELAATQAKLDALVRTAAMLEAGIADHVARAKADGQSPNFGVLACHRDALLAFVRAAKVTL